MKKIDAYEFKDLEAHIQETVRERVINQEVEFCLHALGNDPTLENENDYWNAIGCSKSYGESTSWFVPAVYYEKHKKEVDENVDEYLSTSLFTKRGQVIN